MAPGPACAQSSFRPARRAPGPACAQFHAVSPLRRSVHCSCSSSPALAGQPVARTHRRADPPAVRVETGALRDASALGMSGWRCARCWRTGPTAPTRCRLDRPSTWLADLAVGETPPGRGSRRNSLARPARRVHPAGPAGAGQAGIVRRPDHRHPQRATPAVAVRPAGRGRAGQPGRVLRPSRGHPARHPRLGGAGGHPRAGRGPLGGSAWRDSCCARPRSGWNWSATTSPRTRARAGSGSPPRRAPRWSR